jgi:hypothetical protein
MIVSNNKGGLSNRIKSIVSVIRISKIKKIEYKVLWRVLNNYKEENHILNCPFDLLFKNDILIDNLDTNDNYNSHCLFISKEDNIPKDFNNFNSKCKKKKSKKFGNRTIDFMYNEIPQILKNEYIEYFKILEPVKQLQTEIDEFSKKFNEKTISIHIRSWNRKNEQVRKILFNLDNIENEIEKYDETYNFYLASDCQEVKDKLNKKYGNRILIYPRKTSLDNSRDFPEGIQEDLIELYLLSKNKIIIGSHFSTYTEVSWWLGGCTKNITIL